MKSSCAEPEASCFVVPRSSAPGMQIATVPQPGAMTTIADSTKGCLSIVRTDPPQHLGLQAQEDVTFSGKIADRRPPTAASADDETEIAKLTDGVRPLTWGDRLLEAWLAAIRGAPLTDADYAGAGLARDADPFRIR